MQAPVGSLALDPRTGGVVYVQKPGTSSAQLVQTDTDLNETLPMNIAGFGQPLVEDVPVIDQVSGLCLIASSALASAGQRGTLQGIDASGNVVFEDTTSDAVDIDSLTLVPGVGFAVIRHRPTSSTIEVYDMTGQALDKRDANGITMLAGGDVPRLYGRRVNQSFIIRSATATQFVWGAAGTAYCDQTPNSTSAPGRLRIAGSDLATDNRLTLVADQLPIGAFVLFVTGTLPTLIPGAGGSAGDLCVGGQLGRFGGQGHLGQASFAGRRSLQIDLNAVPSPFGAAVVLSGETRYFQLWHRDGAIAQGSHFTNAVQVTLR